MTSLNHQDHFAEILATVRNLLDKQQVVENLVHKETDTPKHDLVESLVHRQHLAELQTKLDRIHTADVARILEVLPIEDRHKIWKLVISKRGGDILVEVSDTVRENLIAELSRDELANVLNQMDADDLAYIAESVPPDLLQARLNTLNDDERTWLTSAMSYEEDSVGLLMTHELVTVRDTDSLQHVAENLRSRQELPAHNDKLFVVDRRKVLVGVLPLQDILLNDPSKRVQDVMATDVVTFRAEDDANEAAQAFERYDLLSAPVVNARGRVIGRLTIDAVVDYIREQSATDVLSMAGLKGDEDLFAPVRNSARNRAQWLAVNLVTAFIASAVIGLFESTIDRLVALAALMPIVASIAGNSGNQTTALIIRALSHGHITPDNTLYLVRKELGISLLNGSLLGLAVGVFAFLFYQNVALSVVIAVAVILTLIIAAAVGLAVPLLLDRVGRDPAIGSSVILTATTDSMGFFIFLGLATVFLR